jgi:hypothetical protein
VVELRPVREEARHLQGDDVRIDLREAGRGERPAVDLLAPHLADHGDLVALGAVEVPGELDLALALLVDGLRPCLEDLSPRRIGRRERAELDLDVGLLLFVGGSDVAGDRERQHDEPDESCHLANHAIFS